MGVEPYRIRGFTSEVSPAYDIFHYVLKKGLKATGAFLLSYYAK
jgi:hypothetical protein